MGPIIAILDWTDASPVMVEAMVSACSKAYSSCKAGPAEEGELTASFRWLDPRHLSAGVSVDLPGGKRERVLRFSAVDPEIERWRAAGVAIAILVGEAEPEPEQRPPASPPTSASSAPPLPPPPSPSPPPPHRPPPRLRGHLGPVLSVGLGGQPRIGGEGRLAVGWGTFALGATFSSEVNGVAERLGWGALGVMSAPVPLSWGQLRARLEGLLERLDTELLVGEAHDARHRWMVGGRAGIEASRLLGRGVWIGATVELGLRAGKTVVFRDGQEIGTFYLFRPGAGVWLGTEM